MFHYRQEQNVQKANANSQENLDENDAIFETSPSKLLVQLPQQTGV